MHRSASPSRSLSFTRAAVAGGAAVAAVLIGAGGATAATSAPSTSPVVSSAPTEGIPCTGSPFDAIIGPYLGNNCGGGEGGEPGETPDDGSTPPPPGALL